MRFLAAKNDFLQLLRETAVGDAQLAVEEIDYGLREVQGFPFS